MIILGIPLTTSPILLISNTLVSVFPSCLSATANVSTTWYSNLDLCKVVGSRDYRLNKVSNCSRSSQDYEGVQFWSFPEKANIIYNFSPSPFSHLQDNISCKLRLNQVSKAKQLMNNYQVLAFKSCFMKQF